MYDYDAASTKDLAHTRRNKGKLGPLVTFTPEMCLISTKELFLGKKQNKQKFICMLGAELAQYNCQIYHDTADADFLIAMKTIESAENIDTVLSLFSFFTMPNVSISKYFLCRNLKKVLSCVYGTSENPMRNEEHSCVSTFYSFMLSLEQIPLHAFMDLEKLH